MNVESGLESKENDHNSKLLENKEDKEKKSECIQFSEVNFFNCFFYSICMSFLIKVIITIFFIYHNSLISINIYKKKKKKFNNN